MNFERYVPVINSHLSTSLVSRNYEYFCSYITGQDNVRWNYIDILQFQCNSVVENLKDGAFKNILVFVIICVFWSTPEILLIRSNQMQQYAVIYLLQNHSTSFGCPSHPSSGEHKTATAASGTGHNIWETTFLQRGQIMTTS